MPDSNPLQAEVTNGVLQASYRRNTLASEVTVIKRMTVKDIAGSSTQQRFLRLRMDFH
ncbi:MAG: hypothetical protein ACTHLW_02740 [Verrucomicrobiota bacterium]